MAGVKSALQKSGNEINVKYISKNCKVNLVVFTGVAGAVNKKLKQWDIVLSEAIIQHDMDARPLFDKFVIPAIGEKQIKVKESLINYFFYDILEKHKK